MEKICQERITTCPVCGNSFKKSKFNHKQIYCNKKCRVDAWTPKYIKKNSEKKEKKEKKCNGCKQILPIDNFQICDKYGNRRGKCIPCHIIHRHKLIGNLDEYKKEKEYKEELHILQIENKRRCRVCREVKDLENFPNDNFGRVYYNKKTYCKECGWNVYSKPYMQSERGKQNKAKSDKRYSSKPETKEKTNKKAIQKYHNDPQFKMLCSLRGRINKSFKSKNLVKTKNRLRSIELLGCTIEETKEHLEKQFKEGMSWENHGTHGWHIDHIIPCASFDLTDPEQQKKCFHYTNLQPLWAKENISKGAKIFIEK